MSWMHISIGLTGGLSIFLYGMFLASEALQNSATNHLKAFLKKVTKNQAYGAGVGIILAALLQSSTAATVMVVGFVHSKLITLRQAMGVVLGSAIGTTLTVQLIAFKITDYALAFVAVGFFLGLISASQQTKYLGNILLGFGFIFFGMALITSAMEPIQEDPQIIAWFLSSSGNIIFTVLAAILFTIIVQNSAATIAIAMTLTAGGSLSLEAAIAIVYGANVGTVVTALIASVKASKDAQRAAIAHALFKIIGVLVFLPFTYLFVNLIDSLGGTLERKIANAHTIFNVVNLIILLPFCNMFATWMTKLVKDTPEPQAHLDKQSLTFPTVALIQAQKELQGMARGIQEKMFEPLPIIFQHNELKHIDTISKEEQKMDSAYRSVYKYLRHITKKDLTEQELSDSLQMLYINNDLEGISDVLKDIAQLARKLNEANYALNEWEKQAISQLYEQVLISYQQAIDAFIEQDEQKAMQVIYRNPHIIRLEKELRFKHFHTVGGDSSGISSIYTDIMNGFLRINHHVVNISQTMIGLI